MRFVEGKGTMNRVVVGTLHFYHRPSVKPGESSSHQSVWGEQQRFHDAVERSIIELRYLEERASDQVDAQTGSIFAVHAMLLEDENFVRTVDRLIRTEKLTAERAVWKVAISYVEQFNDLEDPYMRARASDIQDVFSRVLRKLTGSTWQLDLNSPVILVSDSLFPSEVMEASHQKVLGIVSRNDNVGSHSAMLLNGYRIPSVAQADIPSEWEGRTVLMDSGTGRIYLEPNLEMISALVPQYA